jgi:hypothetical protein
MLDGLLQWVLCGFIMWKLAMLHVFGIGCQVSAMLVSWEISLGALVVALEGNAEKRGGCGLQDAYLGQIFV